ncbi:MAG: YgfZ/GcvT domain-containing protein [Thermosynechococcaceae cyanobacterium]
MLQTLKDYQRSHQAQFETNGDAVVYSFGQDDDALATLQTGSVVCDLTHWGLLELTGADRLNFLHNQSTNDVRGLQPGQSCDTVILTSTARTLDLVSVYVTEESVLLLVSPNRRERLLQWFDRYIFFGDKVEICDRTDTLTTFSLLGPQSVSLLQKLGVTLPEGADQHRLCTLGTLSVRVATGNGLAIPGYTLMVEHDQAADLWQRLVEAGAVPIGTQAWEQLRILQGRPYPDAELTEDFNPLEAGLWQTISLDKGCYIGQETIARLNTYNGVKQQLWGLKLSGKAEIGTVLMDGDQKVGVLTSQVQTSQGWRGLGYVKTKAGGAGLQLTAQDVTATVVEVPFLTRAVSTV